MLYRVEHANQLLVIVRSESFDLTLGKARHHVFLSRVETSGIIHFSTPYASGMNAIAKINLTDKQATFVSGIIKGLEPEAAARDAGFSAPRLDAWRLLRAPSVLYAVDLGLRKKLHGELVPLAFKTLIALVQNADSDRVKLDAAKIILDRAGFVPAKQATSHDDREPEAMSTTELHALIERLERELGDRAAPVGETVDAQAVDIVEEIVPD